MEIENLTDNALVAIMIIIRNAGQRLLRGLPFTSDALIILDPIYEEYEEEEIIRFGLPWEEEGGSQ